MGTEHEVLAAVLQIRDGALSGARRGAARRPPDEGRWALPGGRLGPDEDVEASVLRQLAEKVDVREVAHVEQIGVFSRPDRVPGARVVATAFLGLVPCDAHPAVPDDTAWHPVAAPPPTAFDHAAIVAAAHERLRAKLSYTNLGFALAPRTFTISALRDLYAAALGHPVSATNLQRVLTRRGVLEPTGGVAAPGPDGRPTCGALPLHPAHAAGDRRVRRAQAARRSGPGSRTVDAVAETVPLFPLGTVLMPGATLPLHIFEPRYRQLTVDLVTGAVPDKEFGIVAVREGFTPDDDGHRGAAHRRLHGRAARRPAAARRPLRHRHPRHPALPAVGSRRRVEALPHGFGGVPARRETEADLDGQAADLTRMLSASARAAHRRYCDTAWK